MKRTMTRTENIFLLFNVFRLFEIFPPRIFKPEQARKNWLLFFLAMNFYIFFYDYHNYYHLLRFKPLIHEVVKHFEGAGPKPQNSEKVKEHQVSQSFTTTVFL